MLVVGSKGIKHFVELNLSGKDSGVFFPRFTNRPFSSFSPSVKIVHSLRIVYKLEKLTGGQTKDRISTLVRKVSTLYQHSACLYVDPVQL